MGPNIRLLIAPLVLLMILVGLIGLVLLYRGWRGVPMLSYPRCARCKYDLRGFAQQTPTKCAECGADLTAPEAIRWGDYRKQPRMMWTGAAMIALPLVLAAAAIVTTAAGVRLDQIRTNKQIIASLPQTANQPWDWQELDRRRASGLLGKEEMGQAIDQLIASLNAQGGSGNQPLTWSQTFVENSLQAGAVSDEQFLRLAKAYYGQPKITMSSRVRSGAPARFEIVFGGHWDLPGVEFVKALRSVKSKDGKSLVAIADDDHQARHSGKKPDPDQLSATGSWDLRGDVTIELPPGEQTLTFTLEAGLLRSGTKPQIASGKPGQPRHWPKGPGRWTVDVPVTVTVVPPNESPIGLVTDPANDPQTAGWSVKSARVTKTGDGSRLTVEFQRGRPPVPVSFDVFARVSGAEHPMGWVVVGADRSVSGSHHVDFKPVLPADVKTVDVILRPNPAHAEQVPGITEVWGKAFELKNIRLERYDLETGDDDAAQSP